MRVSAVVATRDRPGLIGECLRSLLAEADSGMEILVVDQSGDDQSSRVVAAIQAEGFAVRYVRAEPVGLSAARNVGLRAAREEVVAFVDDDATVASGWLAALRAEFDDPSVAAVCGRILPGSDVARRGDEVAVKPTMQRQEYARVTPPWHIGHGANLALRRADLLKLGGFDLLLGAGGRFRSCEDGDALHRLLASGKRVVYSPTMLVYHRQWRDWAGRKKTERGYGIGAGAQFAKYLRSGDLRGFALWANWAWELGVRRTGAGLLKWRDPRVVRLGLFQLLYPLLGALMSLSMPVDRRHRIYEASIDDRWDAGTGESGSHALLTSEAWARVMSRSGAKVRRIRLGSGATALMVLRLPWPFTCAEIPGVVLDRTDSLDDVLRWCRRHMVTRVRVDLESPPSADDEWHDRGFRSVGGLLRHTVVVPLGSEPDMLAQSRPRVRRALRHAGTAGLVVEDSSDVEEFAALTAATAHRTGVFQPGAAFYRAIMADAPGAHMYIARLDGEPLAGVLFAEFRGRAHYLFGGSSGQRKDLAPLVAAIWEAMRAAADRGCRECDLWGVPPSDDAAHRAHGLWQLKTGFGGEVVDKGGQWELTLAPRRARIGDAGARWKRAIQARSRGVRLGLGQWGAVLWEERGPLARVRPRRLGDQRHA